MRGGDGLTGGLLEIGHANGGGVFYVTVLYQHFVTYMHVKMKAAREKVFPGNIRNVEFVYIIKGKGVMQSEYVAKCCTCPGSLRYCARLPHLVQPCLP